MALSVGDIDQWNPASLSAVAEASRSRAESAAQASSVLGSLPAFTTWQGTASESAAQTTLALMLRLEGHRQDATAVARASSIAANEVSRIKSQLGTLRAAAGAWGIGIASPGTAVSLIDPAALPLPMRLVLPQVLKQTQTSLDLLRDAADQADSFLADSIAQLTVNEDGDTVLAEGSVSTGEHSAWKDEISGKHDFGNGMSVEGSLGAEVLSGEADADYQIGSDGISAGANARGTLAAAEANGSFNRGPLSGDGSARVAAEATADANASLGKDGVNVGAEAFIGARASAEGSVDLGGVGAEGGVEGWAGAGISADVDLGVEHGKVTIGAEYGAALGLGGKGSFEVTIDPGEVVDTVTDTVGKIWPF